MLNGSESHDDHSIVSYEWRCVECPAGVRLLPNNQSVVNATGLTKGFYTFSLTVRDDNDNTASDNVTVTVNQSNNSFFYIIFFIDFYYRNS